MDDLFEYAKTHEDIIIESCADIEKYKALIEYFAHKVNGASINYIKESSCCEKHFINAVNAIFSAALQLGLEIGISYNKQQKDLKELDIIFHGK